MDTKGHLCHESILTLTTLLRSTYNRDLRMLTITNISTMSDVIHLLLDADDSFISVASFIADARIMCLSLVTATTCINIDRTVFQETDMLKNCKPLKQLTSCFNYVTFLAIFEPLNATSNHPPYFAPFY